MPSLSARSLAISLPLEPCCLPIVMIINDASNSNFLFLFFYIYIIALFVKNSTYIKNFSCIHFKYDKEEKTDGEYGAPDRLVACDEPDLDGVSGVACRTHRLGGDRALPAGRLGVVPVHDLCGIRREICRDSARLRGDRP